MRPFFEPHPHLKKKNLFLEARLIEVAPGLEQVSWETPGPSSGPSDPFLHNYRFTALFGPGHRRRPQSASLDSESGRR